MVDLFVIKSSYTDFKFTQLKMVAKMASLAQFDQISTLKHL